MSAAREYNPLAVCLVAAVAGISIASLVPVPLLFWLVPFLASSCLWWLLCREKACDGNAVSSPKGKRVLFCSTLAVCGVVASFFAIRYTHQLEEWKQDEWSLFNSSNSTVMVADAWIRDTPSLRSVRQPFHQSPGELQTQTVFTAQLCRIRRHDGWDSCKARIYVTVAGDATTLEAGRRVRLWGIANRCLKTGNPGEFDQRFHMQCRGISAYVRINSPGGVLLEEGGTRFPIRCALEKTRLALYDVFSNWISSDNRPLAAAMVLGMRHELDSDQLEVFRNTGTVHILAISGMHLAIVTAILFFFLKLCLVPRVVTSVILMVFVGVYAAIAGGNPPVVRAALFVCVYFTGSLLRRSISSINVMALTGLLVLLYNPLQLFDMGAIFSFFAAGTFLWSVGTRAESKSSRLRRSSLATAVHDISDSGKLRSILFDVTAESLTKLFRISTIIWLVLLPLTLKVSNLVSPVAMLINPLVWPAVWGSLFFSFLLVLCHGSLDLLRPFLGVAADQCYGLLTDWIRLADHCPHGHVYAPAPPDWWLIGLYVPLAFWALFPDLRPRRGRRYAMIAGWCVIGMSVLFVGQLERRHNDTLELVAFAVGHGNATLVSFPDGRSMLYDCGSFSSPRKTGYIVSKYILNRMKWHIDLLLLSHPDTDHYNAVEYLLERVAVRAIVVPPGMFEKDDVNLQHFEQILRERGIPVYEMARNDSLAPLHFPELTLLHPTAGTCPTKKESSNAQSLVVLLEYMNRKILMTGDLDAEQVDFLEEAPQKINVLFAPHHGGRSRNIQSLLQWSTPSTVFVSAGRFQSDRQFVSTFADRNLEVFSTFDNGALFLYISGNGKRNTKSGRLTVRAWRNQVPVASAAAP